jgi:hypothetical protein
VHHGHVGARATSAVVNACVRFARYAAGCVESPRGIKSGFKELRAAQALVPIALASRRS